MPLNWMHCCDWLHTLPNRIYTSKEETRCLEKIYNFLLFPLLSRTTLLWGTNQGLITIHYITFSILTASKNEKPGESMKMTQLFSERQGFLWWVPHKGFLSSMKMSCLQSRSPPSEQESTEEKHRSVN